mgnify:FL=1
MKEIIGKQRYVWLVVVCILAFFANAGVLDSDIMEARNLVTAREMVEYDNWMVPTMNGDLRLEKPPLPTWVAAIIEAVSPENIVAQRAAAGVMGTLWALFLFLTVKVIARSKRAALTSTLVFLTCYNVILMGRTATWDIYCHAFMQGAVWLLFKLFYRPETVRRRVWTFVAAGLLMGLSFMSKGPVSFFAMLLPFIIACAFYGRPHGGKGTGLGLTLMIALTVVISVWWYISVYVFHPEVASYVFNKESASWVNHNVRPWYYYWRFFAEMGVWALATLAALFSPLFLRRMRRDKALLFGVTWMLATVILLSFMPEKKMRYLLPLCAPCAMSVGLWLEWVSDNWNRDKWSCLLYRINGWLITVITLGLSGAVIYLWLGMEKVNAWVAVVCAVLFLGIAAVMAVTTVKGHVHTFVDSVCCIFIVAEVMLMGQISHFFSNPHYNSISATRHDPRLRGYDFYYLHPTQTPRMEMVLEAGRRVRPLDYANPDSVMARLPMVTVSNRPVGELLPREVLAQVDTVYIGTYDNNHHAPGKQHYTDLLYNRITIIKKKQ